MNYEVFTNKANKYLDNLKTNLEYANCNIKSHWNIDHICYRTESYDQYTELKNDISKFSHELIESEVNGRPITTFKLAHSLNFGGNIIQLLELPAPKPNKITKEGFEHIEIVCDQDFKDLKKNYSQFEIKTSGLNKNFNPELAVSIQGSNIKFHHISLESVVTLESNKNIFNALLESKILETYDEYNPQVVGTYPLGINLENSDIDIVLNANNLNILSDKLKTNCKRFDDLHFEDGVINEEKYILVKFTFKDVPFEVFAQEIPVFKQQAFKHFQIEERILKLGGDSFKAQIKELRSEGIKTEPAFAKAMNLTGDPYQSLLQLALYSEPELRNILNGKK